ncbi:MAG: NAD-dependent epimerase/dehydratase family protein [Desulfuromonadales bacterium]
MRPVLITGGAGFIGANLADRLAGAGRRVLIFDNLSRAGVRQNLDWLQSTHGERVSVEIADIRDFESVRQAVVKADTVFHLAAQVAVTSSLAGPVEDFEINARGALNVLEALRSLAEPPPLVFTSTNKVYGRLDGIELRESETSYLPTSAAVRANGIGEGQPLEFYSPYGCSKGTADQYVLDYARIYHLPAVVFRMSCIYGPHQFGTEDQGWVAHFLLRALRKEAITLFGNGKQVRDILYVEDLVRALLLAAGGMDRLRGQVFNIGGGPDNAVSLRQVLARIGELEGLPVPLDFAEPRPGDQNYYVSDIRRFARLTGWRPQVDSSEGVARLHAWLWEHRLPVEQAHTLLKAAP